MAPVLMTTGELPNPFRVDAEAEADPTAHLDRPLLPSEDAEADLDAAFDSLLAGEAPPPATPMRESAGLSAEDLEEASMTEAELAAEARRVEASAAEARPNAAPPVVPISGPDGGLGLAGRVGF
jgi:hypothetical protein